MRIRVQTRQTPSGDVPCRLTFDGRQVEVDEVLDAWHGAEEVYFKLRGHDRHTYLVRFDERSGIWQLTMFDTAQGRQLLESLAGHREPAWKRKAGLASPPKPVH